MSTQSISGEKTITRTKTVYRGGASEAVYGLGMIGAWVYYLSHAATFGVGVLGFLKGIVWPAFLVYEALKLMGM